uniref:Uncharacterized protein n=1 Tax=Globisporangium ultimum (strain ATCC 200006 / CBS 805.95 / DAOM BR144) TaxID=431595 RepID=K3X263_GLOUD
MDSPNTPCSMTSHQAIMKCPWQWRQPFLDEKRESRKRKVGDGYFYDPVDPNFVDHLLPGYAKKFCANLLESDEKEKIQMEIQRLMTKKEEQADRMFYDALFFGESESKTAKQHTTTKSSSDKRSAEADADLLLSPQSSTASSDKESSSSSNDVVSQENMALIDSILLMTKSVDESSLLASPKSVSSPLSPVLEEDDDVDSLNLNSSDESNSFDEPLFERSSSLDLVSDNLQDNYFASEDGDLLDFPTSSSISSD